MLGLIDFEAVNARLPRPPEQVVGEAISEIALYVAGDDSQARCKNTVVLMREILDRFYKSFDDRG